jgi:hypothetical protein
VVALLEFLSVEEKEISRAAVSAVGQKYLDWYWSIRLTKPALATTAIGGYLVDDRLEPFDNSWIDRPIFARFELIADRTPDKIALDDGEFCLTYQEVQQATRHLAVRVEAAVPMGARSFYRRIGLPRHQPACLSRSIKIIRLNATTRS